MANKLLLLTLLLFVSCGKDVSISNTKLKNNSSLNDGTNVPNMSGVLKRGTPDTITANGATYKVSMYSSYSALEFIAAKPLGTQVSVKYKGMIKNNEMVLEIIQ